MIKVGDLVRIKHTDVVALVTRIALVDNYYKSITKPVEWVYLSGQDMPIKASKLELVNASR